ncbi:hypothetical protein Tco_0178006 [Tanacetum coccineum]
MGDTLKDKEEREIQRSENVYKDQEQASRDSNLSKCLNSLQASNRRYSNTKGIDLGNFEENPLDWHADYGKSHPEWPTPSTLIDHCVLPLLIPTIVPCNERRNLNSEFKQSSNKLSIKSRLQKEDLDMWRCHDKDRVVTIPTKKGDLFDEYNDTLIDAIGTNQFMTTLCFHKLVNDMNDYYGSPQHSNSSDETQVFSAQTNNLIALDLLPTHRTHATVHDGNIVTEQFRGWPTDKAFTDGSLKRKGDVLMPEAEAFLA